MKNILLPALVVTLLLTSCASWRREVEVEIPARHDAVVQDEIPAEGGRKIPVIKKY
ncbi:hypothetical protein BH20VER3_BH20VER3_12030 [soil metagenome]